MNIIDVLFDTAKMKVLKTYQKMVEDIERRIILVENAKKEFAEQEARREQQERDEDLRLHIALRYETAKGLRDLNNAPFDDGFVSGRESAENDGSEAQVAENEDVYVDVEARFEGIILSLSRILSFVTICDMKTM
jgi:hypothetical protein